MITTKWDKFIFICDLVIHHDLSECAREGDLYKHKTVGVAGYMIAKWN